MNTNQRDPNLVVVGGSASARAGSRPGLAARLASMQPESLASRIDRLEEPGSPPDFNQRLVPLHNYRLSSSSPSRATPRTLNGSYSNVATMATRSTASSGSIAIERVPSLTNTYSTGISYSSPSTSSASNIQFRMLPTDDDFQEAPGRSLPPPQPQYRCMWAFLACTKRRDSLESWLDHCKTHFKGREPFRELQCPFNCAWSTSQGNGEAAWAKMVEHCFNRHNSKAESVANRRPSHEMIMHLNQIDVIGDEQVKELRRHGELGKDPNAYLICSNSKTEKRRLPRHGRR